MSNSILPPVLHVLPLTTIRRDRQLPVPGTISVRLNEKVQAQDVIADGELAPRRIFIDVARGLGIREKEVAQTLVHHPGDHLESGDPIAGPVGVARRTVRAPSDGRIVAVSGGRVLFEVLAEPVSLRAGLPGLVISTDGSRSVTLEATGALIQGVWGNGLEEYGMLRTVGGGAGDKMQTSQLDINLRGAVLIAGICDHPAPLHQATELSVRGLVLGSMPSELIPAARRLPYPLILIEGFGEIPMNSAAYSLLTSNVGREAAVLAKTGDAYSFQRPEVIIPLPASRQTDLPDDVIPLKQGVRVRVVRAPYQGAVGVIRDLPAKAFDFPSGLLARGATVELEGHGTRSVPLANLEVLN